MRLLLQRVSQASVTVDSQEVSRISVGILTLLGIEKGDDEAKLRKLIQKVIDLRIFPDDLGKMNLSLKDIGGEHLIVSQFTLVGDCSTGRRPSFTQAETPARAKDLYELAISVSNTAGVRTVGGIFQADMKVALINDGPVTFFLEE